MNYLKRIIQKPEIAFVIIASCFGLFSSVFLPVLAVPDENQHFQISYAMFSANKRAPQDLVFNEAMILSTTQAHQYKELFSKKTSVTQDGVALNTGSLVFDGKTRASIFDIMHLPQAIGVLVGKLIYPSVGIMVLAGRLFTLALYITALYYIIKKTRHGKWTLMFVACLPILIQQAASVSYDAINVIAIFAWVGFIINIATQQVAVTRRQVVIGTLLALFLFLSKGNNLFLLAFLLAIPPRQLTETAIFQRIKNHRHWNLAKYTLYALAGIIACAAIYLMSVKLLAGQEFHPRRLIEVLLNTFFWGDLALIDVTTIGIIGQFSNFYYHFPIWIVVLTFIILAIILLGEAIPRVSKRFAAISGLLFFGSVLLISIGMYYAWALKPERLGPTADVTDGIQGRYFTPLLVVLIPAFAWLQKYVRISSKASFIPLLSICSSITLLALYSLQTWHFFWT